MFPTAALLRISIPLVLFLGACSGSSDLRLADGSTSTRPAASSPTTASSATTATTTPAEGGDVIVTQVVDGDTIDVRVDGVAERVRIIGINTPERDECLADKATGWLRDRIAGRAVTLVRDRSDRDRFGRLLRYVEIDGADVGVESVRAGLAIARRYPPDTARAAELDIVQQAAEDDGVGMWAPDACGAGATNADLVISDVRFDADGNDNDNLNDEWVRITNRGTSRVDLSGWVLKDESASHRYSFPGGFGLDPDSTVTVRTGCGNDSGDELHWCNTDSAVWNNSGDTAFLLDPAGNVVDSRSA